MTIFTTSKDSIVRVLHIEKEEEVIHNNVMYVDINGNDILLHMYDKDKDDEFIIHKFSKIDYLLYMGGERK